MARYIDADKFEQAIKGKEVFQGYFDNGFIYDELNRQPTADVVEVVRCKDCVAKKQNSNLEPFVCARNNILVYDNCFCSYGERIDT